MTKRPLAPGGHLEPCPIISSFSDLRSIKADLIIINLPYLSHTRRSLCHLELTPGKGYPVSFFIGFLSSPSLSQSVSLQV